MAMNRPGTHDWKATIQGQHRHQSDKVRQRHTSHLWNELGGSTMGRGLSALNCSTPGPSPRVHEDLPAGAGYQLQWRRAKKTKKQSISMIAQTKEQFNLWLLEDPTSPFEMSLPKRSRPPGDPRWKLGSFRGVIRQLFFSSTSYRQNRILNRPSISAP